MDGLRRKYDHAVITARIMGMVGSVAEHDGRLFLKGTVGTRERAAKIWQAIKLVPSWRHEVIAEIQVVRNGPGH
jgi:hypothetical protein